MMEIPITMCKWKKIELKKAIQEATQDTKNIKISKLEQISFEKLKDMFLAEDENGILSLNLEAIRNCTNDKLDNVIDSLHKNETYRNHDYSIKEIADKYNLSLTKISSITNIPYDTLQHWNMAAAKAPEYILYLIDANLAADSTKTNDDLGETSHSKNVTKEMIKELRNMTGLTQKEFAKKYHFTSYTTLKGWEIGKGNMPGYAYELLKKHIKRELNNK